MVQFKVPWCWIDEQTQTLFVDILDWLTQYTPNYKLIGIQKANHFTLVFETKEDLLRFKLSQSRPIVKDDGTEMQRVLAIILAEEIRKEIDNEILAALGFSS